MINPAKAKGLEINNDIKILMTAVNYDNNRHPDETILSLMI